MLFRPHYQVERVEELTPDTLQKWQLRWLLLDVDCTLTRYRRRDVSEAVAAWIETLRGNGVGLCLVSNGLSQRIEEFAQRRDLPFVGRALKPLPFGIWTAMRRLQAVRTETAMVGDQVFADMMAGNLAGVRTILVDPIHPEEEPWFTQLKRGPERWLRRRWLRRH